MRDVNDKNRVVWLLYVLYMATLDIFIDHQLNNNMFFCFISNNTIVFVYDSKIGLYQNFYA